MSWPKNFIVPVYFVNNPSIQENKVDFPAPLGPIMPKKSLSSIEKLTLSSAFTSGYSTFRSLISTIFNYTMPPLDLKDCFPF